MSETTDGTSTHDKTSDEPPLLRATAIITRNPKARQDGRVADMLLLFLAAAGTVLGTLLGAVCFLFFSRFKAPTIGWVVSLLASTALGGVCGCAIVMIQLHAREMIIWEQQRDIDSAL
jgi:hypothetical protein